MMISIAGLDSVIFQLSWFAQQGEQAFIKYNRLREAD